MTHICVGNLTIIGPDDGLSPGRRQVIIWTNAGILLNGPWGTNFSEILLGIHTFSFKKIHLKMSSVKWHPFCLGLNVLSWKRLAFRILLRHSFDAPCRVINTTCNGLSVTTVAYVSGEESLMWLFWLTVDLLALKQMRESFGLLNQWPVSDVMSWTEHNC